ncbi:probable G-protein coupled receptor Mth-like 3 isoform X2 [Eriocheir sinensis]|uniref:probable G-protein coupled receptor Mth-like 3 isoform X2 n=1 Tax=Eriocheir sinensis TaxID=95602 RepID=UPI0021C5D5E4|nr:probable G-protein coupled receptor Mth-like 3 isoform X2 [Eriocheir sinensis]
MMMVVIKLLVVMIMCVSFVKTETRNATAFCCPERKDGSHGGCPAGAATGHFQPDIITTDNDTMVQVTWKTQAVTCPPSSTLVYHDNATTPNHFILRDQDELELSYAPLGLFDKLTRDYCLEGDGEGGYRIAACKPDPDNICGGGVCMPKCCREGEVIENFICMRRNESPPLQFYSIYGEPIPSPTNIAVVGDSVPDCEAKGEFSSYREENFHLLVNGKLLESEDHFFRDFDEYCIDNSYDAEGNVSVIAVVCSASQSHAIYIKQQMMKAGYIISDVFLIITIIFHLLIPSLRDTQGLILLSHMVSMLVALTVLFLLSISSQSMSRAYCIFNGFVFQYFFLAMFFWLNIMCFDIWRVIRATARGIPLIGILSNDAKKFKLYCLYGWGSPLVITIVTAIMHFLPDELAKDITRPGFGKLTCWLPGDLEHLIYCYAYVGALFILDLLFIGHTMFMLYQAGNAFMCFARFWQRFGVFILMVSCWTAEILSWKIHPQEIWIITDFINSSQGFVIFIIFISSKKRRDMVKEVLKKSSNTCCPRASSPTQSSKNNLLATWKATSPSASTSGPSGNTEEESVSKTDKKDSD